jgi:dGTPase
MNTKEEENLLGFVAANPEDAEPEHTEKDDPDRMKFQRDRDRIIYSRAFRRLKGKTQVFLAGYDDHVRNHLTHTLEVSQLATSIAVSLNLNLMLTEAIALGHDLGHTPFWHVGERALNDIMNDGTIDSGNRGFKHNWQSIRVVEFLETAYRDYQGLNLTDYTRWGILNHPNNPNRTLESSLKHSAMVRVFWLGCRRPASSSQRFSSQAFNSIKSANRARGVNNPSRTLPT